MFILIDPEKRLELKLGELVVAYHEAPGDYCLELIAGAQRDPVSGKPGTPKTTPNFLARFIVDWSGVGDSRGNPVPWPAPGMHGDAVPLADVALRERLLGLLPWDMLLRLDHAVARRWQEGVASGKD